MSGMIKQLKRLGQRGDTIVEVMIVLAVLGLALSISYATANRGLQQSRNAQEHSQALGIIDSQVELLRSAFAKQAGSTLPGTPFCLAPPGASQVVNPTTLGTGANGFRESIKTDPIDPGDPNANTAYPGPCTQNNLYRVSIVNRGSGVYDLRVRWSGISNLGRQQEELTYKVSTVTLSGGGGYGDSETPPPPPFSGALTVTVKAIPPTGPQGTAYDPTPNCGLAWTATNKNGITVNLTGTGGLFTKSTDINSIASFTGVQQGDTYAIGINRAGWILCPGQNTGVPSATAPVPNVTRYIYPQCSPYYTYHYNWVFGARHPELDGYYYTIPPASYSYPNAYSSFVAGPPYRWYVWSGDWSRAGEGLLYYWIWDAVWTLTSIDTQYYCSP
jgi:prepilin-type N-terminal cleavage/methylation domain-containing protein